MVKDDVQLIYDILSGDEGAFSELVNKYRKSVHSFAWRKIGDYHIAEEITQDTFLQVYKKLPTLQDPIRFSGWLFTIAHRQCLARLRKKRIVMQSLDSTSEEILEKSAYASYVAEQREIASAERRSEIVYNLLEMLPGTERTTMILHYLGEMSCKAISEALGVPLNTVKSRLSRARNRLVQEEPILQDDIYQGQGDNFMENQDISTPVPVGSYEGDVTTWLLPEGAIARLGRGSEPKIAFSPDGQSLAIGTCIGLWIYDLATLSPISLWEAEQGVAYDVAFSPNGKWIAASFSDRILKIFDVQNGTCLTQVKFETFVESTTFSHDNKYIAVNSSDYGGTPVVVVHHAETGKLYAKFTADDERAGHYQPISFSPGTRLIVSTCMSANSDEAGSILVWDMKSRELIACLSAHKYWVTTLCFSPCGKFLTSGSKDGTVFVWDVNTWQQIREYTDYGHPYSIVVPSYTPDGILLAVIMNYEETGPATISVRDLESNEQLYSDQVWGNNIEFASIGDWGNNVLFSNGSQLAYECRHEYINVWTLDNPNKRQFTHSPISWPRSIVFSQDGKTLAAEHFQEGVVLWDIESKRSRPAIKEVSAGKNQFLYKTNDGRLYVASIINETVTLWEADGNGIPLIEGTGREYWSASPALAPTGTLFAYAGEDGTVQVLDVQNGEKLHEFTHPLEPPNDDDEDEDDHVHDLEFSQDGKLLVSTSKSRNVKLWDMELGEEIETLPGDEIKGVRFCRCGLYHAYLGKEGKQYWDITQQEYCEDVTCLCNPTWTEIVKKLSYPPEFEQFEGLGAYSVCGQYMAIETSHKDLKSYPIDLWDVTSGKHLVTFRGPTDILEEIAFSPDNKLLASSSYDGTILLWDLTPYL